MNKAEKEILKKILYAVETGGQVYGKQRYDAFIEAYTNTSNEKAITIGAGQWYAGEAKKLLLLIRSTNPTQFKVMDFAGIGSDLDSKNWSYYNVKKDSQEAKCIQRIISSDVGVACQDKLMIQQIESYEKNISKTYGSMTAGAMMECINIIHQGGNKALKRILAKTKKPYTVDSIYAALCTDPADRSNTNQVGDYVSRQKKVYEMIKKHVAEGNETKVKTVNDVIELGKKYTKEKYREVGGTSNNNIFSTWVNNAGLMGCQNQPWCGTFQFALDLKIFGKEKALKLWNMTDKYVGYSVFATRDKFPASKRVKKPVLGALIIYDYSHMGRVAKIYSDGSFDSLEGNTTLSGNSRDGGYVAIKRRTSTHNIQCFCVIDYDEVKSTETSTKKSNTTTKTSTKYTLKQFVKDVQKVTGSAVDGIAGNETISNTITVSATKNRKHAVVKYIQKRFNALGYDCGSVDGVAGPKFTKAAKAFQKANDCVSDGEITARNKTWKKLLGMI